MKAAIYFKPGGPDQMQCVDLPDPIAGPGEVLIEVEAISIEAGEMLARSYMEPGDNPGPSGYAAAGKVVLVGSGVEGFAAGDRVTTFGFGGAYAEQRSVVASNCWKVPAGLDIELAATAPVGFGTAAFALDLGGVKKGDTVLIQGATGGVGIAAVQLAVLAGAKVLGTSRSAEALEHLYPLGLSHGVVVGDVPVAEQVRRLLAGKGCDILLDNVGGDAFREGLKALEDGGRAVIVGIAGPGDKRVDTAELLTRRLHVVGCFLGPIIGEPSQRRFVEQAMADLAAGRLTMPISGRFSLTDVVDAQRMAEAVGGKGRVIMRP